MARITDKDIEEIVESINTRLKENGVSNLEYVYSPRNAYLMVDIVTDSGGREGVYAESKKEMFGKLYAMSNLLCEIYG